MREVLQALNALASVGTIGDYAIGGAVGASFYLEAVQTEDVDAFVFVPDSPAGLFSLTPIYEALVEQGGVIEREYVRFGSWPLQILTDATPLLEESIRTAVEVEFDGVPTRVFRPEHLCAVALQTGRTKDYLRVGMFLDHSAVNLVALQDLVQRYGLAEKLAKVKE